MLPDRVIPSGPESETLRKEDFIQLHGPLFEDVQLSRRCFPDSKTFPDSVPLVDPKIILERYEATKMDPDFSLSEFVTQYFAIPLDLTPGIDAREIPHENKPMSRYIQEVWPLLLRSSDREEENSTLIPLEHEYVVPGGRFREIYYWDSFFTSLGLLRSNRPEIVVNICRNFSDLIDRVGHIPNGNRVYYETRSQPPYFAMIVDLLQESGIKEYSEFIPYVEKEYSFWMKGQEDLLDHGDSRDRVVKMPDGEVLNRYYDNDDSPREESYFEDHTYAQQLPPEKRADFYRNVRAAAESGWDFSSRWFDDLSNMSTIKTTGIVPVDLNSLLYFMEYKLSEWHAQAGNKEKAQIFSAAANKRKEAILKYFWSDEDGFFFDFDFRNGERTKAWSLAAVQSLVAGIATPEQANFVAGHIQDKFLKEGGVAASLHETGQQWDMPNGWPNLQWLAVTGLVRYRHTELAKEIRTRFLKACEDNYAITESMYEKINVVSPMERARGGEYPSQVGFGWTNGVALDFIQGVI